MRGPSITVPSRRRSNVRAVDDGSEPVPKETPRQPKRRRRPVHRTTLVVAAIGLVLTAALSYATASARSTNEDRLLRQRTREAAAVLTAAVPGVQTPLASALQAVELSGDQEAFARLLAPIVKKGTPYVSASLWRADGSDLTPLEVVGPTPQLASRSPEFIRSYLQKSVATTKLSVVGLLDGDAPRLGYAITTTIAPIQYVAYAEAALPPNRTSVVPKTSAFTGLHNAVYLGDTEDTRSLLTASTPHVPLRGRRASEHVDFGDTSLLLVMTPDGHLGGTLLYILPLLVIAFGLMTTLGSATLTEWLLRRRAHAEHLSDENARLYAAQRSVAETLQQSLLPSRAAKVPGVVIDFRYVPGVAGLDIGGDWYDAIPLDEGRLMVIVGDVSGRGLGAGTVMASLRYAVRAFASQGDTPTVILHKLNALLDVHDDGHFATVLCAVIDIASHSVTFANAGHPNPLLIEGEHALVIETEVGLPIGVRRDAEYAPITRGVAAGATLLMFTDGLFERRTESVDVGLERLRQSASGSRRSLADTLSEIIDVQTPGGGDDDTAVVGVQWQS